MSSEPMHTLAETNYFAKGTVKGLYREAIVTGLFTSVVCKTITAPIQRLQLLMRLNTPRTVQFLRASSLFQYLEHTKLLGLRSLWRGNQANCWLSFFQLTFQLTVFDSLKSFFDRDAFQLREHLFGWSTYLIEPLIAATLSLSLLYPIDVARVRLTANPYKVAKTALFTGIPSCLHLAKIQTGKYRYMYRGAELALLTAFINYSCFFAIKTTIETKDLRELGALGLGLLLYPLQTLMKRVQFNNFNQPTIYVDSIQCLHEVILNKDYLGLFRGLQYSFLRSVITLASGMALFSMLTQKQLLRQ